MKIKIDLDKNCEHDLCDCLKRAIEAKVLPEVYDEGFRDGADEIISAIPTIVVSAAKAMDAGISAEDWCKEMSKQLTNMTRSVLAPTKTEKKA